MGTAPVRPEWRLRYEPASLVGPSPASCRPRSYSPVWNVTDPHEIASVTARDASSRHRPTGLVGVMYITFMRHGRPLHTMHVRMSRYLLIITVRIGEIALGHRNV